MRISPLFTKVMAPAALSLAIAFTPAQAQNADMPEIRFQNTVNFVACMEAKSVEILTAEVAKKKQLLANIPLGVAREYGAEKFVEDFAREFSDYDEQMDVQFTLCAAQAFGVAADEVPSRKGDLGVFFEFLQANLDEDLMKEMGAASAKKLADQIMIQIYGPDALTP